ncbi:hypothetical protein Pla110_17320 [Polystyrenella longa]|uniref:DUF4142 domain-containing protein n=1 Tax=Polystyrenella longa TaxID=2528007 RepID=A0A518CLA6_9PLAN|nr:hypothetical protein [Polystyrenella longa]QDU80010.1 hypothetical protein Pla110_17320 [Polystyrenella longa]
MFKTTLTLFGCAAMGTFLTLPALSAQERDAAETPTNTEVEVDSNGVEVNVTDREQNRPVDRRSNADQTMNGEIADWLMVDQQFTLQIAEFGMQRTKTPEVQELLKTLLQDHQALSESLSQMTFTTPSERNQEGVRDTGLTRAEKRIERHQAKRELREDRNDGPVEKTAETIEEGVATILKGAERIATNDQPNQRERNDRINEDRPIREDDVTDQERVVVNRPEGPDSDMASSRWIGVHQEINNQLIANAKKDLGARQGYEFDAALVGMLVGDHLEQAATLSVLEKHATGDLQKAIADASKIINQHRESAEQVMQSIVPEQR